MADDTTPQVLKWLSSLEPYARHQAVCADRIDGIGNWVLETKEFLEWSGGGGGPDRDVLFCYGEPGVGKTYLSSLVLNYLSFQCRGKDVVLSGLYYDFAAQKEQSPANMLGVILKQVIDAEDARGHISHGFPQGAFGLPDLARMLKKALSSWQGAFICIDGLDECLAEHRARFLESLREIRYLRGVRLFLTGRRDVRDEIEKHFGDVDVLPVDPSISDLMTFAKTKLDKDKKFRAMDNHLKEDIVRDIPGKITETFLVASLAIDSILAEPTISYRRKKLKEMTEAQGLDEAYAATLERMRAERGRNAGVGIEILMFVSHSERPLQVNELCHAVKVNIGRNGRAAYGVLVEKLLECSLGLVTVGGPSSTVRLVHHTLQEYLLCHPSVFMKSHLTMARGCLEYLIHRCANRNLSPTAAVRAPAFANYASCYWGVHATKGNIEDVKPLAFRLLNRYDTHISPRLLLMGSDYWPRYAPLGDPFKGFSALHCVAFFGIAALIVAMRKERRGNVNQRDAFGATPLLWAARMGKLEGVRALLEWVGIDPNIYDSEGQTPLSEAAMNGHDEIVKLLLARDDIDPSGASVGFCWVPLVLAASRGHEAIAKALLARGDVNPNQPEAALGQAPLSRAAKAGHEGIVRLLLAREDIDPNYLEKGCGQPPLLLATASGHQGVVELLLARGDLNPGIAQEALKQAAEDGHEGIVNLLLARGDVNHKATDTSGRTPLFWAAEKGHVGVVKLLLAREDVNPGGPEKDCSQTPLSLAATSGHRGVVELLLARGDLSPGIAQEAFKQAAQHGHEEIVSLLLAREDVNPNATNTSGRTPLSWAAEKGHEGVVRLLAARDEVDPDLADLGGRTPLSWAALGGHEGTVGHLLTLNDVDPQTVDIRGCSPLFCAAGNSQESIVKLLLSRAGVWPQLLNDWSRLIIQRASLEEHESQESS